MESVPFTKAGLNQVNGVWQIENLEIRGCSSSPVLAKTMLLLNFVAA